MKIFRVFPLRTPTVTSCTNHTHLQRVTSFSFHFVKILFFIFLFYFYFTFFFLFILFLFFHSVITFSILSYSHFSYTHHIHSLWSVLHIDCLRVRQTGKEKDNTSSCEQDVTSPTRQHSTLLCYNKASHHVIWGVLTHCLNTRSPFRCIVKPFRCLAKLEQYKHPF